MAEVFSIIVPVLNRQNLIVRCLDSILAQSYRPIHLIVVDNNSSDNTFQTVTDWGRKNARDGLTMDLISEPRPGAAAARNRGLRAASSRYVMFMDSDDTMAPSLAYDAMMAFNENPGTQIVAWKARVNYPLGHSRIRKSTDSNFIRQQIIHAVLCTVCMAVDREFIYKAEGWDSSLLGWDDLELGIRLLSKSPKIVFLPKVLIDIHHQNISITGDGFAHGAGKWEKALDHAEDAIAKSDLREKDALIQLLDYRRVNLAGIYRHENHPKIAARLYKETLRKFSGSPFRKFILRLAYHHSACGLRGAYILPEIFFR